MAQEKPHEAHLLRERLFSRSGRFLRRPPLLTCIQAVTWVALPRWSPVPCQRSGSPIEDV